MRLPVITAIIGIAFTVPAAHAANYPGTLKVSFQTLDCNGATGLGSVNVDAISRVQPYDCPNGKKLKQVLTRMPGGTNEVFTISESESEKLEARIQKIMDARQKSLEQTKPIIINH